ncbi:MAG TPA: type III-B CRISPR module-associated protein Cmr5 [bacterium]|nr:type III-B CRISPR module-associated protein Cmr5 [bacterium]HPG46053.1 type III-B CRISPR module-associated protein Cmr5 [bacterium]HPM97875.1 type III-B CRISPR module-associated protein Cmr5 [bacterium]
MSIPSREIFIAKKAKQIVDKLDLQGEEKEEDFVNFLKGLPSDISQNGIMQTVLFLNSKIDKSKDKKYEKLYSNLLTFYNDYFSKSADSLEDEFVQISNIVNYLHVQQVFISFTIWLKRFALSLKTND